MTIVMTTRYGFQINCSRVVYRPLISGILFAIIWLMNINPLGVQILSISCSFGENWAKSYVGAPHPPGLVRPPRGNPGSATGYGFICTSQTDIVGTRVKVWVHVRLLGASRSAGKRYSYLRLLHYQSSESIGSTVGKS